MTPEKAVMFVKKRHGDGASSDGYHVRLLISDKAHIHGTLHAMAIIRMILPTKCKGSLFPKIDGDSNRIIK